jgi:PPOX class probable F420-dependent enzyme
MVQLDESPSPERAQDFLRARKIVWLATIHPSGRPHIAPVWFLWDQNAVTIVSQPDAQKVRNLQANPSCSIAVDDSENGHQPVAFDGVASLEPGALPGYIRDRYIEKYGEMLEAMNWTPEQLFEAYSQVILITPTRFLKIT